QRAYGDFAPETQESHLATLRQEIFGSGHLFLSDDDGNDPGSSHPAASPWVFGEDCFTTMYTILAVRAKALADFSGGAVPPGSQTGELETRFALVHLLHRYQAAAVAKLVGGVGYAYGDAADPATSPVPVAPEPQRRALEVLVRL